MSRFRPSLTATLGLLTLAVLCLALAAWQARRADEKAARQLAWSNAGTQLGLPPAKTAPEFLRVSLRGHFDTRHHLLADNQVLRGRSGVHVYTPFTDSEGSTLLVNRGWLPLPPTRSPLPGVVTEAGELTVSGRLGNMPQAGRRLGPDQPMSTNRWPQLVTYPSIAKMARALGIELYPRVLYLDADSPGGFEGRNWKPVYMTPDKHRAYAFQWTALAIMCLLFWIVTGIRRAKAN